MPLLNSSSKDKDIHIKWQCDNETDWRFCQNKEVPSLVQEDLRYLKDCKSRKKLQLNRKMHKVSYRSNEKFL